VLEKDRGPRHGKELDYGQSQEYRSDQLHFHSRDGAPSPEDRAKKKRVGIFKQNPSLMLILIDIIVIVLVILFLIPALRPDTRVRDFHGYSFSLHGFRNGDEISLSLVIQANGSAPIQNRDGTAAEYFELEFSIHDGELSARERVSLDRIAKEPLVVRKKFVIPQEIYENSIVSRCVVSYGQDKARLQKSVTAPEL